MMLLLAPGLFRLDVRPSEDTLQVMTRSLRDGARWGTEPGGGDRLRAQGGRDAGARPRRLHLLRRGRRAGGARARDAAVHDRPRAGRDALRRARDPARGRSVQCAPPAERLRLPSERMDVTTSSGPAPRRGAGYDPESVHAHLRSAATGSTTARPRRRSARRATR